MFSVVQYELKDCRLINSKTGKEILKFDARSITEKELRGGFVGSGLASHSQAFSIATATKHNFMPFEYSVIVDGVTYVITARKPLTHIAPGKNFTGENNSEMVLTLE